MKTYRFSLSEGKMVEHPGGNWVSKDEANALREALKEILAAKNEPHYGYIDVAWDHLSDAVDKHAHLVDVTAAHT